MRLSQVRPEDSHELVAGLDGFAALPLDDVEADVILQDFGKEAGQGPATSRDALQDHVAFQLLLECPFDGFDLAPNAAHAADEPPLRPDGV
jgi:hypothetical protein